MIYRAKQYVSSNVTFLRWRRGLRVLAIAALGLMLASETVYGQSRSAGQSGGAALPASLQKIFSEGVEALKADQLDAAEAAFRQVLRQGGKVSFVYNNLGIVYQRRGEHELAVAQFREAIRLQPDYVAPRTLAGASLLAMEKVQEAVGELERAVKLQPREPLARQQLARAYERDGNPAAVVEQFQVLRELAPEEPEYAYQLGSAYLKVSGWCYQQIVQVNPNSARAHEIRAEVSRAQGRKELALRHFQRAAEADTTLAGIHLSMAEIYLEDGKEADAHREIEQELAIAPGSVAALALKKRLEASSTAPR